MTRNEAPGSFISSRERSRQTWLPAAVAVGVLAALSAGVEFGFVMGKHAGSRSVRTSSPGHIYHSGDSLQVAPGLQVKIDGWRVEIDKSATNRFMEVNDADPNVTQDVELKLVSPDSGQTQTPTEDISSDGGSGGSFIVPIKEADYLVARPTYGDPMYLIVHRSEDKFNGNKIRPVDLGDTTYRIQPTIYSEHQTKKQKANYESPRILSETDIEQPQLDEAAKLARLFDDFMNTPPIYVYQTDDQLSRGGDFDPSSYTANLTSLSFTDPRIPKEYLAAEYHELSHALLQEQIDQQNDEVPVVKMIEAYRELARAGGFRLPIEVSGLLGPSADQENSIFAIFDESHYSRTKREAELEKQGVFYGHPYQNFNELFASAMTVMHFFPHQFMEKYQALPPHQQAAVKNVIKTINEILLSYPDVGQEDVAKLQPHLAELLKLQ